MGSLWRPGGDPRQSRPEAPHPSSDVGVLRAPEALVEWGGQSGLQIFGGVYGQGAQRLKSPAGQQGQRLLPKTGLMGGFLAVGRGGWSRV